MLVCMVLFIFIFTGMGIASDVIHASVFHFVFLVFKVEVKFQCGWICLFGADIVGFQASPAPPQEVTRKCGVYVPLPLTTSVIGSLRIQKPHPNQYQPPAQFRQGQIKS